MNEITFIMPVKDPHPEYIRETMQSVIAQSDKKWRMIVICDSQDDVAVARSAGDDARVSWICSPASMCGAINIGLRAAETDFVAEVCCDDMLAPTAIETMCLYIEAFPNVDFFHSSRVIVDDDGRTLRTCWSKRAEKREDFLAGHVKHMLCWRRQKAPALEEGMHAGDDFDLPWSMFDAGCRFKPVMECLYVYRDHRRQPRLTTHVPLDKQEADLRMCFKKHGMNDGEIEKEITERKGGYLKQVLFLNDKDMIEKQGVTAIGAGWRET